MKNHTIIQFLWVKNSLRGIVHKIPLCMRLSIIMLFAFVGLALANEGYAQKTRLNIAVENKTVEEVLDEIEKKTEFTFFYNNRQINIKRRVTVNANEEDVFNVLNKVFKGTDISYKVLDRSIILSTSKDASPHVAQQNTKKITGHVKDQNGDPVIGATVMLKGKTNGTITDIDGNFTLPDVEQGTVQVSFVGYRTQEVNATANRTVVITLVEDTKLLSEVVVVGFSTQRKENLTGAVSSVDVEKTLGGRPIADVGRGLQGTTPGLSVVIPSGEVGSDPTIKIRGQIGSIEGGSAPLILLDNVEIPSIQMVNPDDIESISVLKDAASASIYGSKAAFGVVLITTKKGAKQESVSVTYSGNMSWQNISKKMDMAGIDGMEYSIAAMLRSPTNTGATGGFIKITEEGLARAKEWQENYAGKIGPNDPYVYGRDWYVDNIGWRVGIRTFDPYDYMIKEWTPTMNHNLSVNGRSGKTTYNIGLGYLDQTGMMKPAKHDDFKRYNGTVKVSTEINKYITVRGGTLYSKRVKRYPYVTSSTTADPWLYLYRWGPNMPMGYDDEGNILRSPVSEAEQANTASREWNYTNFNVGATINIAKNWTLDVDYTHSNEEYILKNPGTRYTALNTWGGPVAKNDADGNRIYVNTAGEQVASTTPGAMPAYKFNLIEYTGHGANPDHVYQERVNSKRNTLNIVSNYNLKLSQSDTFRFLIGMNRVTYDREDIYAKKIDLSDILNPQFNMAVGTQESGGDFDWEGQLGFFGRINYAHKEKYLLEANLRYDATSKFPSDLRWRAFPSFSAGWRINEESWMNWAKPALSALKLRASWGSIGDQTVPNSLYVSTLQVQENNWLGANGKKLVQAGLPTSVASNITWQDISTFDAGIDARFFDGELGVTFDWYQRDTKNMIVPGAGVTWAFGTDSPKGNYGSLRTKGWEIAVDYNHRFKNGLGVNLMVTLSDAVTEVSDYGDETNIDKWYKGKTYGEIWGYRTERLYQKDDFVYDANGNLQQTVVNGKTVNELKDPKGAYQEYLQGGEFYFGPGDVKFVDLDKSGRIDDGSRTIDDHGDLEVIGNSTPRYEYGFRIGADYKGFDFSVFFQGVGKREIWGDGFLAIAGYNSSDGAMPQTIAGDYWREDRTNAFYPRPYNQAGSNNSYNMVRQSRYLLDMSYLRMKNVTLGYTLPGDLTRKARIQKARVYMALENFLTFDNLNGLPIDPEEIQGYSMFNTSNYNSGRTGVGTPTFKSISVGLQLNF